MIADLVSIFVDRLVQLAEVHEKSSRDFFTDFIEPINTDFEILHKNYLDNFREYQQIALSSKEPFNNEHPIFLRIKQDAIHSNGQRAKILNLLKLIDKPQIGSYIHAIHAYLGRLNSLLVQRNTEPIAENVIRASLTQSFKYLATSQDSDEVKKIYVVETVDNMVEWLQIRYENVNLEYSKLKVFFLK